MTGREGPVRRAALRAGDRVRYHDRGHTVIGLSGTLVRLRGDDGTEAALLMTHLQTAADFAVLGGSPGSTLPGIGLLALVPAEALDRARWWERHILEVETGRAGPDDLDEVREMYDPACTSLGQRELTKLDELAAAGTRISLRSLRRYRAAYTAAGLWGLVDHRGTRQASPTGRVDARVVVAARAAMAEQVDQSTGTRGRVRRRTAAVLAERYGPGVVDLPPESTFYRLLSALETGQHTFGAATTRRALANRPVGPFSTVAAARPGELVHVDTTPLDVMALLDDGVTARVELTILVDLGTRTICSGLLRPHGTKAVDAALLLARALVPEPMRPGWPDALAMRRSRLPHAELTAADARLAEAAAKPVIVPETIVCDRGSVYLSGTFLAACARLGISLQPAHPGTPTDKGVVERTFSSINTLFCQYVAGYTGRDPTRRGRDVEGTAVWSLAELQDLFDQWVLAGWQPRPHDGLRHPGMPRAALSPNEMYASLVAAAGYLPLALSAGDYLELLPVQWRKITAEGVRLGSLTYDCAALNAYRGQQSSHRNRRGRWPVHHDPYDLGQVWIRRPGDDAAEHEHDRGGVPGWIQVSWVHRGRVRAPFADFTLRHTRRVLAERGGDHADQLAVAEALDALLTRAATGPGDGKLGRRVAAKTRAATSTSLLVVPRATADDDENAQDVSAGDDAPDEDVTLLEALPIDDVVPFGIFDAHAEARRFW